jgi:thioredoxin-related protein
MPPSEPGAVISGPGATRSGPTRATPVVLLALALVLLAARVAFGIYEHVRPVERADRIEWREPAAGEAEARADARLSLDCFTRDGDPPSRQMSREVFADPRMAQAIQKQFVPVRVLDLGREEGQNPPDVARLEREYGVTEFPTLVVALPGRERFEKLAGYPGPMGTTQFISGATQRLLLRPGRQRTIPDSAVTIPAPGGAGAGGH